MPLMIDGTIVTGVKVITQSNSGGVPSGCIVIWSGSSDNIPDGWHLCDGTDGTPNLRDRFVLGAGNSHEVGETGGSEEVTLTVEQMPSHNHVLPVRSSTSGSSSGLLVVGTGNGSNSGNYVKYAGSSNPHPNMPPYYTLCYIMKL